MTPQTLASRAAALWVTALTLGCALNKTHAPVQSAAATAAPPTLLTSFDPSKGGLPEGLVIGNGIAYVGFAPLGEVVIVNLVGGAVKPWGSVPKPVAGKGFMTGLQTTRDGALLAALVSFTPEVQPGIYRIPPTGGPAVLFAKHPQMVFPNGFAEDGAGGQYVTDSAAGAVFHMSPDGHITRWLADATLKGNTDYCGHGVGAGFDIGANGIARVGSMLYISNNDLAQVVAVPIGADGAAGAAKTLAGPDCANLGGADGLVVAPDGRLIVADNRLNKIVFVEHDGSLRVIAAGPPLDFPASVAFDGESLLITNFALANALAGKTPAPGLIRIGVQ